MSGVPVAPVAVLCSTTMSCTSGPSPAQASQSRCAVPVVLPLIVTRSAPQLAVFFVGSMSNTEPPPLWSVLPETRTSDPAVTETPCRPAPVNVEPVTVTCLAKTAGPAGQPLQLLLLMICTKSPYGFVACTAVMVIVSTPPT